MPSPKTYLVITLLVSSFVFFLSSYYVSHKQSVVRDTLQNAISVQQENLLTVAEKTHRSVADAVVETYVRDCSLETREQFDSQLRTLNTLNTEQLEEMQIYFEACAGYFADTKVAMVARLQDSYDTLKTYIDTYEVIDGRIPLVLLTEDWELFIRSQQQQADLLVEQVEIQRDVIELLVTGIGLDASAIRLKMTKAQELNDSAAVLGKQIDMVYARLKKL